MKSKVMSSYGLRFAAIAALTTIIAAACGDDNTNSAPPPPNQGGATTEITIPIEAGAAERTDDAFGVNPMSIKAGTKVTWVNNDSVPHTATSDDEGVWDSGTLAPGASFSHVFADVGSFPYHCTIHPGMKGTIEVTDGASPSPSPSGSASPSPSPSPSTTSSPSPTPSPSGSMTPTTPVSVTIDTGASVRGTDAFGTNPLVIPAGTQVTWTNNDSQTHTATSTTPGVFDSGPISSGGGTFSHTFKDVGTFPYICTIHPNMQGTIEVTEHH